MDPARYHGLNIRLWLSLRHGASPLAARELKAGGDAGLDRFNVVEPASISTASRTLAASPAVQRRSDRTRTRGTVPCFRGCGFGALPRLPGRIAARHRIATIVSLGSSRSSTGLDPGAPDRHRGGRTPTRGRARMSLRYRALAGVSVSAGEPIVDCSWHVRVGLVRSSSWWDEGISPVVWLFGLGGVPGS